MVLFNGGVVGGGTALGQAPAHPSRNRTGSSFQPPPGGRWLQRMWGWEDTASRLTRSPAGQPASPPTAEPLASPGPGRGGPAAAGCFCHKRTLCLSYK